MSLPILGKFLKPAAPALLNLQTQLQKCQTGFQTL